MLITDRLFIGRLLENGSVYDNGNSGSSKTIDWNNGITQKVKLTANCTLSFTDPTTTLSDCVTHLTLIVEQDDTGGYTASFPSAVSWPNNDSAPVITTGANSVDITNFYALKVSGSWSYYGMYLQDFS